MDNKQDCELLIFKKDNSDNKHMSDLHSMAEARKTGKIIEVIEPNTTRVLEMRRIKAEQQRENDKKL